MHYAMQLTYNNDCKPYAPHDEIAENKFEDISKDLNSVNTTQPDSLDLIVRQVFDFYPKDVWHAELIVRVPHLMARYKNEEEKLKEIRETYGKALFGFFEGETLPQMREKLELIKPKQEIMEINCLVGLLTSVWNSDIRYNEYRLKQPEILNSNAGDELKIISSNVPQLTLHLMFQLLFKTNGPSIELNHIFAKLSSLKNFDSLNTILDAFKSKVQPLLIVDCFSELGHFHVTNEIFKKFKNRGRIILICHRDLNFKMPIRSYQSLELNHSWSEFERSSREKLLTKQVNINERSVRLEELMSINSKACEHLPFYKLLKGQTITVNKTPKFNFKEMKLKFYIQRTFIANSENNLENNKQTRNSAWNSRKKSKHLAGFKITIDNLIQKAEENRIVVIFGTAGTGKTSTLFHIYETLKRKFPTHWVSFIDLKQHIEAFSKILNPNRASQDFADFLIENVFTFDEKPFNKNVFLELFKNAKTVIMLDGFDEISPVYKELILSVIKSFDVQAGNQLWITTRSHLKNDLENNLSCFSCGIEPLTNQDQVEFLVEYWKAERTSMEIDDQLNLKREAQQLIFKLSSVLKAGDSDLVGVPLQVLMIAEIYENDSISIDTLNFHTIYEKFFLKKFQIWLDKCLKREQIENIQTIGARSIHHRIALRYIFGSNTELDDEDEWQSEAIERVGIIHFGDATGDARFVHETFAEFLVSDFIILKLKVENKDQATVHQLLFDVLSSQRLHMVRLFLNKALDDFTAVKKLGKSFANFVARNGEVGIKLMKNILPEGLENLVDFMLLVMMNLESKDLKEKILLGKSSAGENVLMLASASKSFSIFEKIWSYSKAILSYNERSRMIEESDGDGSNVLHYAVYENDKIAIKYFCDIIEDQLNTEEQKNLFQKRGILSQNIFHRAALNLKNEEIFTTIWNCVKDILTTEDVKKLLLQKDSNGKNVLHILLIQSNEKAFKDFLIVLKENFDEEFQKLLFADRETEFETSPLSLAGEHSNEKIVKAVWSFAESIFDQDTLKKFLTETDKEGSNLLHLAVMRNSKPVIECLCKILKAQLKIDELKVFFQKVGNKNQNIFHYVAFNSKHEEIFTTLWSYTESVLTKEEVKELLEQNDSSQNNVFETLIVESDDEVFEDFFAVLKRNFDTENLKLLLSNIGRRWKRNWLSFAVVNSSRAVLESLWLFSKSIFEDEALNNFLTESDNNGENSLQLAICSNSKTVIEYVCELLKDQLSVVEQKNIYQKQGLESGNIFHYAAINFEDKDIFSTVFDCTRNVLTKEEIKILLEQRNSFGNNPLHVLLVENDDKALEDFFEFLERNFDTRYVKHVVSEKESKFRRNLLSLAATNPNHRVLDSLWLPLKSIFSDEALTNFLLQTDKYKSNALHVAVNFSTQTVIESLFKIIKKQLNKNEQKKFLQKRDCKAQNFFHRAALNLVNQHIFTTLWNCVETVLSKKEVERLITQKNSDGKDVLYLILTRNKDKALNNFFEFLKYNFDRNFQRQLLSNKGSHFERNLFSVAAQNGNPAILKVFWYNAKSLFNENELDDLLYDKTKMESESYRRAIEMNNNHIRMMISKIEHLSIRKT